MMRYQRVSPDYLPPLTNGITKKPYLTPSPSHQDTTTSIAGRGSYTTTSSKGFGFGFRSTQQQDPPSPLRRGGDVLLQWGQRQRKRSRNSRTEIRSTTDDSSSSSGQGLVQSNNKRQRRFVNPCMPPPTPSTFSVRNSTNPRNGFVAGKELRNLEDRLTNGSTPSRTNNNNNNNRMISRSATVSKRSPPSPDQTEKRSSLRDQNNHQRQNGFDQQRVNRSETNLEMDGEREKATTQVEVVEWPRIYIALSRKEKEEDFLVMKGTKLPHRPRKRAKNIDKALQYCFPPGMWLSDLTKNRYEVREKKNVKKQQKRRGLKGLENLDSDSE